MTLDSALPRRGGCVVLVPVGGAIDPACDDALRELERRGYAVWRVRGYSAIDAARNQMATDALAQGFDELIWIDSDVVFRPDDVDRLRAHGLPFVCGLYSKKSRREFAATFLPGTRQRPVRRRGRADRGPVLRVRVRLHPQGRCTEASSETLRLPTCNQRFGSLLVPYFAPLAVNDGEGDWYLSEDYAFCERARQAGFKVMADTSIRLWHVGTYRFGWEDAGADPQRFADYTFHLRPPAGRHPPEPPGPADP